jgi:type I restriction enzyme, S subunit
MNPRYKPTEAGVIPVDWDVVAFGDMINYTKGFPFKSGDYQSDGIRVIRVSDTTFDSIKENNPIFIAHDKASRYARWTLKEHDLVLSTVGSKPPMYDSMVGRVILIKKMYEGALLNQMQF